VIDTEEVLYLPHTKLRRHPRNMRRIYPQHKVEEMAASYRSRMARGERAVIEPLIGVRRNGHILIVVGNLRLTAAYTMGEDAPLMPVIIREIDDEEQLLCMVTENKIREDPDPVSEGLHYRVLLQEPEMTVTRLARETGVATTTIQLRLRMLELEQEIQRLIVEEKLPRGGDTVDALLSIPDSSVRVETAEKLAARRARVTTIVSTCARVKAALEGQLVLKAAPSSKRRGGRGLEPAIRDLIARRRLPRSEEVVEALLSVPDPGARMELAMSLADEKAGVRKIVTACAQAKEAIETARAHGVAPAFDAATGELVPRAERPVPWDVIVTAVEMCCRSCPEPLWEEVTRAIEGTCGSCEARRVPGVCTSCGLLAFVQRLVRSVGGSGPGLPRREESTVEVVVGLSAGGDDGNGSGV
jgi:ParB/RepB/Spo0J family partition protein